MQVEEQAMAIVLLRDLVGFKSADFLAYVPLVSVMCSQNNSDVIAQTTCMVVPCREHDHFSEEPEREWLDSSFSTLSSELGVVGGLQFRPFRGEINRNTLKAAWESTQRSTREDWHEWMRRLSVEMLRESPSLAMRSCATLAQIYQPLARQLFNAAFLSCWCELAVDGYQESLVACLETALDAGHMSLEVLQPLLNLAEFMELVDKPLPINIRKLGELAEKCHAYAKALHYREVEFHSYPADTIEALISINNQLQQPEAAKGILTYAWQNYQVWRCCAASP